MHSKLPREELQNVSPHLALEGFNRTKPALNQPGQHVPVTIDALSSLRVGVVHGAAVALGILQPECLQTGLGRMFFAMDATHQINGQIEECELRSQGQDQCHRWHVKRGEHGIREKEQHLHHENRQGSWPQIGGTDLYTVCPGCSSLSALQKCSQLNDTPQTLCVGLVKKDQQLFRMFQEASHAGDGFAFHFRVFLVNAYAWVAQTSCEKSLNGSWLPGKVCAQKSRAENLTK